MANRQRMTKRQIQKVVDLKDRSDLLSFKPFEEEPTSVKARELFNGVSSLVSTLEKTHDGEYFDYWKFQIVKATASIYANLAEGYGRGGANMKLHYLRIARGSAFEVMAHFRTSLTKPDKELRLLCRDVCKDLGDLIQKCAQRELER